MISRTTVQVECVKVGAESLEPACASGAESPNSGCRRLCMWKHMYCSEERERNFPQFLCEVPDMKYFVLRLLAFLQSSFFFSFFFGGAEGRERKCCIVLIN